MGAEQNPTRLHYFPGVYLRSPSRRGLFYPVREFQQFENSEHLLQVKMGQTPHRSRSDGRLSRCRICSSTHTLSRGAHYAERYQPGSLSSILRDSGCAGFTGSADDFRSSIEPCSRLNP